MARFPSMPQLRLQGYCEVVFLYIKTLVSIKWKDAYRLQDAYPRRQQTRTNQAALYSP